MPENRPAYILGIRHHGPGSARSVRDTLERLAPDVILVEGPPEANDLVPLAGDKDMKPPVALLIYVPDQPEQAIYYPFAVFSPEWQAIQYGLAHHIPVRFMDLPQTHWMALRQEVPPELPNLQPDAEKVRGDPLQALAEAAGYRDGERWWESMVEQRRENTDLFTAILEAMRALRGVVPPSEDRIGELREAHMRKMIRAAERDGFQQITVVCGAWHGPALADIGTSAKADETLLKGLPRVNVEATWVPWTYSRLMLASGYGAGIESPGWYEHLWTARNRVTIRWMARVAKLLRKADLDASTAQVIDSIRLAESLAAMRNYSAVGLPELMEATQATLCFGSALPMQLIQDELIVGDLLGNVPPATPMIPLQQDLQRQVKRLRLKPSVQTDLDLDLRQPTDLERSHLLHRLNLLGIRWGKSGNGRGKGTFHEFWRLAWQPEFAIVLIERSTWGNTIRDAASAYTAHLADEASDLPALTTLLNQVLLCDLPDAAQTLMARVQEEAALASSVLHLMNALPSLAHIQRYGNVRQTDTRMVGDIVDGLITRICIGLPGACASLDDEAAGVMFTSLLAAHEAIGLLQNDEQRTAWFATLRQLAEQEGLHGLLAGRACRLLFDAAIVDTDDMSRRMGLALSPSGEPAQAAAWIEGFLHGSGLVILYNEALWRLLDQWVVALSVDVFTALLPLLRRTFATFSAPERRQIAEHASRGPSGPTAARDTEALDEERASTALALVAQLLGVENHDTR